MPTSRTGWMTVAALGPCLHQQVQCQHVLLCHLEHGSRLAGQISTATAKDEEHRNQPWPQQLCHANQGMIGPKQELAACW